MGSLGYALIQYDLGKFHGKTFTQKERIPYASGGRDRNAVAVIQGTWKTASKPL